MPRRSIGLDIRAELRSATGATDTSVELAGPEHLFDVPSRRTVRVVTASDLFSALARRTSLKQALSRLRLVLCENLELLDAVYELGVSLLLHTTQTYPVRFVGLSNSLNDPADLAA